MDNLMYTYVLRVFDLLKQMQQAEQVRQENEEDAQAKYYAYHDELTGLNNRASFRKQCENGSYDTAQITILAIDVNDLKKANDRYGHEKGDELLVLVADTLTTYLRFADIFRMGGDEFCAVLPLCDEQHIRDMVSNLSQGLIQEAKARGFPFDVTVSVGFAVGNPSKSIDEIQRQADMAMYAEKRAYKAATIPDSVPTAKEKALEKQDHLWDAVGQTFILIGALFLILIL